MTFNFMFNKWVQIFCFKTTSGIRAYGSIDEDKMFEEDFESLEALFFFLNQYQAESE